MERVETLCKKLQGQVSQNAPVDQMLVTVQMLQSELLHLKANLPAGTEQPAILHIPLSNQGEGSREPISSIPEEKIVEVLQIDEAEVEAELEEIRKNMQNRDKIHAQTKPALLFDPVEDTPTLTHQAPQPDIEIKRIEIHESLPVDQTASLNEKLKQQKTELSDSLQETAIRDLRKGIGVNDRFLFINELFRGDEVMYERSIKTINGFTIFPEAEYWIKRELKLKLAWNDSNPVVKQFDHLIRRRFSSM